MSLARDRVLVCISRLAYLVQWRIVIAKTYQIVSHLVAATGDDGAFPPSVGLRLCAHHLSTAACVSEVVTSAQRCVFDDKAKRLCCIIAFESRLIMESTFVLECTVGQCALTTTLCCVRVGVRRISYACNIVLGPLGCASARVSFKTITSPGRTHARTHDVSARTRIIYRF